MSDTTVAAPSNYAPSNYSTDYQVQVITSAQGVPERCAVSGWRYVVQQVHGHWVSGSPWWLTGVDVDTHIWRVTLYRPGGTANVMDLRCNGTNWQVTRVGDKTVGKTAEKASDKNLGER